MSHPAVGQPAPPIDVAEWISGRPEGEEVLAGKNVILEFWGTHCGPCISAIPHLNELASTYGGPETLFVSLSPEDSRAIERFLEKRPIKGSVAVDRERATFDAYGIRSIPRTFLIDAKGLLRWHGHPNHFKAELLETFLREDRVPEVAEPAAPPETAPVEAPDAPFFLRIDRNASDRREYGSCNGDGRFEAEFHGCRAVVVIRDLLDHPGSRLRIEGKEPEDLWDVELRSASPLDPEAAKQRAVDVLCDLSGITISRELEEREGWKLTCDQPRMTDMSDLGGGMSTQTSQARLTGSNITIDQLVHKLERSTDGTFFNETELQGKYDFALPLEPLDETRRVLEEEYGIEVEAEVREVEIVTLRIAGDA